MIGVEDQSSGSSKEGRHTETILGEDTPYHFVLLVGAVI